MAKNDELILANGNLEGFSSIDSICETLRGFGGHESVEIEFGRKDPVDEMGCIANANVFFEGFRVWRDGDNRLHINLIVRKDFIPHKMIAQLGGMTRSIARSAASRENGRLGGRPRKANKQAREPISGEAGTKSKSLRTRRRG